MSGYVGAMWGGREGRGLEGDMGGEEVEDRGKGRTESTVEVIEVGQTVF